MTSALTRAYQSVCEVADSGDVKVAMTLSLKGLTEQTVKLSTEITKEGHLKATASQKAVSVTAVAKQ